jgi:hypothetical protein
MQLLRHLLQAVAAVPPSASEKESERARAREEESVRALVYAPPRPYCGRCMCACGIEGEIEGASGIEGAIEGASGREGGW